MKTCYNSKCPNILYRTDISRQKCFKYFCELYLKTFWQRKLYILDIVDIFI